MSWDTRHCGWNGGADPLVRGRRPRRLLVLDEADNIGNELVQGDPRGPAGPPHKFSSCSGGRA